MRSVTGKESKFDAFVDKLKKESPIHIAKRMDAPKWLPIVIRIAAVVVAFLVCAIVTAFFEPRAFGTFFVEMFRGTFGTPRRVINLFEETAILLLIALAVTPAFKMKFWNIGAEGQVLMGALMSATCIWYLGGKVSEGGLIVLCLIAAMAGSAIWTLIPALFKAKWNTNETLFTLMLNYIATALISLVITVWIKSGSGVVGVMAHGHLPLIGNQPYVLNIILIALITVLVWVYLRFSKHGYELSVVGESINTAKYIGISVPKVIIRTMLLSGVLCGVAGWLLVNGASYTINTSLAGGRGFTAILVSWLAHFNPLTMVITSFLVAFMGRGAAQVSTIANIGGSFADIVTSIFFFIVIASEFFVNYKVKFNFAQLRKDLSQLRKDLSQSKENNVTPNSANSIKDIQVSDLQKVTKAFMIVGCILSGFAIIPLMWTIPMIKYYDYHIKQGYRIRLGFKICSLLFVSVISGILMFCDSTQDENEEDKFTRTEVKQTEDIISEEYLANSIDEQISAVQVENNEEQNKEVTE